MFEPAISELARAGLLIRVVDRDSLVANQAVHPAVRDAHLERVFAGAQLRRDIAAEGRLLPDAQRFAIQPDFGEVSDAAQIEQGGGFSSQVRRRDGERFPIHCDAGVKFDAVVVMVRSRDQRIKRGRGWSTAVPLERD